jgi:4-hydroxythreonine-4-phosphate dehydrogenase
MPSGPVKPVVALTTGEPGGIGPDLAVRLAASPAARRGMRLLLVGDADMLARRAERLGLSLRAPVIGSGEAIAGQLAVLHVPLARREKPGRPDPANARYVLGTLDAALAQWRAGLCEALATAPLNKAVINDAGIAFTGHTEYLAEATGTPRVVMMLAGGRPMLRVALATTHLPLSEVPRAIDADGLSETLRILDADLRSRFGIARPRIAVAGLNPHAGESGHLGREEIEVIAPVIARLGRAGLRLTGPLPADTMFTPRILGAHDAVLAMYHDQGLPVLKHAAFGGGINITLGLPVVRTSVDHGTAQDLAVSAAGAASAEVGSLVAAVRLARDLAVAGVSRPKRRSSAGTGR